MSGHTYRITTEYLPAESLICPWQARVARRSDGVYVTTQAGATEDEALRMAAAYIAATNGHAVAGGVYGADDEGNIDPLRPSPTWGAEGA